MKPPSSSNLENQNQRLPQPESDRDWMQLHLSDSDNARETDASRTSTIRSIAGYELVGELGRGDRGVVYKARHLALQRIVALKVLSDSQFARPEGRVRLQSEFQELAELHHAHIAQIYDIGETDGRAYVAREFVDGITLGQWLRRTPPTAAQAARMLELIARAMQHAHDRGVIHRDLTPSNILLCKPKAECSTAKGVSGSIANVFLDVMPKITNFGLAKQMHVADSAGSKEARIVVGTPQYASPEQSRGLASIGPTSDVYSMGVLLYEMLTGRPPFEGANAAETRIMQQSHAPVPPRRLRPTVPRDLETICLRCLQKQPHHRYATAGLLADDLSRFLNGQSVHWRTRWGRIGYWILERRATAAMAIVSIVAMLGLIGAWASFRNSYPTVADRSDGPDLESQISARAERSRLIDSNVSCALALPPESGMPLTYFANAVRLAQEAGDSDRERINRIRFRNWERAATVPAAAIITLPPNSPPPTIWSLHPQGKWVIVATTRDVHLWDLETETELNFPDAANGKVVSAAWDKSGHRLAVGMANGSIRVHAFPNGERLANFDHPAAATALAFVPEGDRLAVAGGFVSVWDLRNRKLVNRPFQIPRAAATVSISSDGSRLAVGCLDGRARVFRTDDVAAGPTAEFPWAHGSNTSPLLPPLFTVDGMHVVAINPTQTQLGFWQSDSGKLSAIWPGTSAATPKRFECISTSSNGRRLAIGGRDGVDMLDISVIGPDLGKTHAQRFENTNSIASIAFDPVSGELLASGSNGVTRINNLEQSGGVFIAGHRPLIGILAATRGKFATLQADGMVRLWNGPQLFLREDLPSDTDLPSRSIISADGRYFVQIAIAESINASRTVQLREVSSGLAVGPKLVADGEVIEAAISPTTEQLALAIVERKADADPTERKCRVEIWNAITGQRLFEAIAISGLCRELRYSPDGRRIAVLCQTGAIAIIDSASGKVSQQLPHVATKSTALPLAEQPAGMFFSRDGASLVSWGVDRNLRIWDVVREKIRFESDAGSEPIQTAEISPDGRYLATGHNRENVAVWDLETGTKRQPERPMAPSDSTTRIRFSRDGNRMITVCSDGLVRVWNWRDGQIVGVPMRHSSEIIAAEFLSDERLIVTVHRRGGVRLWDSHSGLPMSPSGEFARQRCHSAAFAPNLDQVFVGFYDGRIGRFDLRDLLIPETRATSRDPTTDELGRLARVYSGYQLIDDSILCPLSAESWIELWRRSRVGRIRP